MINKLLTGITAGLLFPGFMFAQTLFTYGNKPVSQAEFLRAFEKNPDPGNRQKALQEYLPLYINYKLKVQDALDKKMDTLPNQKTELENYKVQLRENFVNEKANAGKLVQEAFERSQKDILLGHLFIAVDPHDSTSAETAASAAIKATAALKAKQDFATVVNQYSTDEDNKKAGGQAGWITVFSIPYDYETAVYGLPVGGYTEVFKSKFGYHIFKKIAERPAEGKIKIAQIMLINTDKGNAANEKKNMQLADSLYHALKAGSGFDSLAQQFSNDRSSYASGGALPEFGVGTYDPAFEQQAFALKNKGDISRPFTTAYGIHILKLLERHPVAKDFAEADMNGLLRQKVLSGGRIEKAKDKYINAQMQRMSYKAAAFDPQQLWQYTDSSVKGGNTKSLKVNDKTPVFSFGKQTYTANDWAQYVKTIQLSAAGQGEKTYAAMLQDFTHNSAEEYLNNNLDKLEPTFAQQLKEFKDANLLFEAMDKNVWNKAAEDSAGLSQYYQQHKSKYVWGQSALALLITSTDSAMTEDVLAAIKTNPADWRKITEKYPENVIADSGRYELSQIPVVSATHFTKGTVTEPVKNEIDGSKTFSYILDLLPANGQRSFEEARGFVINDYQQVLEEKWIAGLKKKYPVKVDDAAWKKLLASNKIASK